jgi:hypothetical protein
MPTTRQLLADLLANCSKLVETDWTIFFRKLADVPVDAQSDAALIEPLRAAYYAPDALAPRYEARIAGMAAALSRPDSARSRRNRPCGTRGCARPIPSSCCGITWRSRRSTRRRSGDPSLIESLLEVMRHPCDEQPAT